MLKTSLLCLLSVSLFSLPACVESKKFIKNTNTFISTQGNDSFANVTTQFDLGSNVSLSQMDVTVVDPKNSSERGTITFNQLPDGSGEIAVSINLSMITTADPTLGKTLPNGKPLPLVLGAKPGSVLGIPVLDHSVAYIGGDLSQSIFVGAALGIKGFDQVMNQLSTPANIFFNLNASPKIMGVAGIYGSPTSFENGIAVFGKYTAGASLMSKQAQQANAQSDYEIENLNYRTMRRLVKFFQGSKKHELKFY